MKQRTEKKLQANLKAINNDFNTVIFADIEVKFKKMELDAIRALIDDCEKLINEDSDEGHWDILAVYKNVMLYVTCQKHLTAFFCCISKERTA